MSTLKAVTDFQSRLDKQKSSFIFALMTDRIMAFPFTDVVRATLFDIMLGGASPKQVHSIMLLSCSSYISMVLWDILSGNLYFQVFHSSVVWLIRLSQDSNNLHAL